MTKSNLNTNFTMADLDNLRSALRPAPAGNVVARPDVKARLNRELAQTELPTPFGGITIYEMPNQIHDAWLIGDATILKRYLSGELSEADLMAMAESLHPQIAGIKRIKEKGTS